MSRLLRLVQPSEVEALQRSALDAAAITDAARIVEDVRQHGESAVREHAERLGDIAPGEPLSLSREDLERALASISQDDFALLRRVAERIRRFAEAQRKCLLDLDTQVEGGRAGHRWIPVQSAGCYAPGGRFPLPSSVLMTAVTARVAGVEHVWVASPKPPPITLAAAAVAGADGLLAVGGAQAVAALAFGAGGVPACDVIVGPGNKWVTAAKHLVSSSVAIDMLAGPSELVVIADGHADAETVALDLLAQAEHDPDACAILISLDAGLIKGVEEALAGHLAGSPVADIARSALSNGFVCVVESIEEAVGLADQIAPEHLHLHVAGPALAEAVRTCKRYGTMFVGAASAEAVGDYGAGPNHVLPTGGSARHSSGLSVMTFLRARTWLKVDEDASALLDDTVALARLEGLEFHARSAARRR
ncbi:MAG: histidinol dehydrogenase [Fimbriimonadia bacterium]|jgi:phosphoribosyl-ATP pyrophosphohydrolase/phosphoribosyl-AMP cyclohydrolase/histidinol dehydrogenase